MAMSPLDRSILWRSGLYVGLVLVLSNLLLLPVVDTYVLMPVREAVALSSSWVLTLLGLPATASSELISLPRSSVQIVNGCTGVDVIVLLGSAVLVFPASGRAKLIGTAITVLVIGVLNFARVLTLCYFVHSSPQMLELGHLYIWPALIALVCLGTLLVWIQEFAEAPS